MSGVARKPNMNISELQIAHWRLIYKGIDVDAEIAKMDAWLEANPKRAKKNLKRFAVNWLNRTAMDLVEMNLRQREGQRNALVGKAEIRPVADMSHIEMIEEAIKRSRTERRPADDIIRELRQQKGLQVVQTRKEV
jgi:hypothetical protein